MRKYNIVLGFATIVISTGALANGIPTNGYMKRNGTYVQPYHRSAPDENRYNNYTTKGNTNPYTGQQGYVDPYSNPNRNNGNSLYNSDNRNSNYQRRY